ncbi:MAG: radical SAM protein [bacterium]
MKLRMVYSDAEGRLFDHPYLLAAGSDGPAPAALTAHEVIRLPRGSDLMMLPSRRPVGIDPESGEPVVFSSWEGRPVYAAAAFMAPAHTHGHVASFATDPGAPTLPLYAYTALGFANDRFYAAGTRVDRDRRQDPWRFDRAEVERGVAAVLGDLPDNRVARQLEKCALTYNCRAAQNFFLGRYEAPLPTSVACNSRCIGCLSLQEDGDFKAAHDRLKTPPASDEVAEVALRHIGAVDEAVVSFGQGCEGEPLIHGNLLLDAIRLIRNKTHRGTVNLNTNGSRPAVVDNLIAAGLDSIRVSLNSLRPRVYNAYYRPRGYTFGDVLETLAICRKRRIIVSINLLYFPGVTDTVREFDALLQFMRDFGADLIQMRNVNIDPELYVRSLPSGVHEKGFGVRKFIHDLKENFPDLRFGYFNPTKEAYRSGETA